MVNQKKQIIPDDLFGWVMVGATPASLDMPTSVTLALFSAIMSMHIVAGEVTVDDTV